MRKIKTYICRLAIFVMLLGINTQHVYAQEHVINLKDADIRAFIEDVSVVTGKTFIVDPRVTGLVNVSSQTKLTKREVFQVFLDVLRVRGFTAIPTSTGAYRVTLIQGAAQDAPLGVRKDSGFVTSVLKMTHGDAADAAKLIKPVMHSQGRLTANRDGRVLVITDFPENIRKAREIIKAMAVDQPSVEMIRLNRIDARDAREAISNLIGTKVRTNHGQLNTGESVRVVAIDSNNAIVLRGDPADVAQIKKLVLDLDSVSNAPRGKLSVINLRYADGEALATILTKLLEGYSTSEKGQLKPSVVHEPESNSIVINATPEIRSALEGVVRKLDMRKAQVLVEAIIVEISDTVAEDLGVQFVLAGNEDSAIPFMSTNYSRTAPNLLALTGALAGGNLDTGIQSQLQESAVNSLLGLQGGTIGIGGNGSSGMFGAILSAVKNDTDSNVLSTPFVTTMDNMPATFLVGQEVPFSSGETLGNNNSNPFRTINREDVGIKLQVLPQISQGDVIRLEIKQEVSSISPDASLLATDLVTNKREIETTVLADNGEIIVLGGLIEDDEQLYESRVPILGDLPAVGNLFKSHNNSRKRKNLMVFLRPTIIRSRDDAAPLTRRKMDLILEQEMRQRGVDGESARFNQLLDQLDIDRP